MREPSSGLHLKIKYHIANAIVGRLTRKVLYKFYNNTTIFDMLLSIKDRHKLVS